MKPFSNNLIFADTEFSSLDPYRGEILSVGLATLDARELYLELEHEGEVDPWVVENVLPLLEGPKVGREEAVRRIQAFAGKERPFLVTDVGGFDSVYLHKLFGIEAFNATFQWLPIDIASALFLQGENPHGFHERLLPDHEAYRLHHALDDAIMLREAFLKLVGAT